MPEKTAQTEKAESRGKDETKPRSHSDASPSEKKITTTSLSDNDAEIRELERKKRREEREKRLQTRPIITVEVRLDFFCF
jgi:hypothetical protein